MKNVLVLTSTFPRWKADSTPSFVYDLHSSILNYKFTVLAPHHHKAKKKEKMGKLSVERFTYFPSKLQKLAYGAGMLTNAKSSFLAKFQIPSFLKSQYDQAKKIIEKKNVDMIHAHWVLPQGILAAKLSKQYDIPLIVTVHGSDIFALTGPFFKNLQKAVVSQAKIITVNSKSTEKKLLKLFPKAKKKVRLISMGVDTTFFKKKKVKKDKTKSILFVGRLTEQKGVQYLIKAMPAIIKDHNTRLLIAGDGNYKKELKKQSKINNIQNNVTFLGAKRKKDLVDLYNKSDVFVLPSVTGKDGTEGFGLVVAEAMACETPVIGSSSGGIPEVITNGKTGLIFKEKDSKDLAKKISKILNDKNLSAKLGKSGREYVKSNYDWKIVGKKFQSTYGGIL